MDARMPKSLSDRGPQMHSKTIRRFLYDLGITQVFARPRTPSDIATIESSSPSSRANVSTGNYSNPIELISHSNAFAHLLQQGQSSYVDRIRDAGREARRTSRGHYRSAQSPHGASS